MSVVSITAVGAFDAVGSVLVVALMIAPPATAYLLTDNLPRMIGLSALAGIISAVSGYWVAHFLDVSIAGSMATMAGILFGLVFLLAPERGLVAIARRRNRQRIEFARKALASHLFNHEGSPEAAVESEVAHLTHHLRWQPDFAKRIVQSAQQKGLVIRANGHLALTEDGRTLAQETITS
jgi:manganese/zinc/iron transport system permease protein